MKISVQASVLQHTVPASRESLTFFQRSLRKGDPSCQGQLQLLTDLCRGQSLPVMDERQIESLAKLADLHGLLPAFESAVAKAGPAEAGGLKNLAASVRQRRLAEVGRALRLAAETLRLVRELDEASITAVPFKGCVLAQMAHGDCGFRNSCDIDLFVRRSELEATIQELQGMGYVLEPSWGKAVKGGHFRFDCECSLRHPERDTCIDLHWEFTARNFSLAMPIERLFARLESFHFQGQEIRTFKSEDLLLILCLHASKHYWQKLEWPFTISRYIERHPDLDWRMILREAADMRVDRLLSAGLLLAHYFFRTPLPNDVLISIMPDAAAWRMVRQCMQWMALEPGYTPSPFQVRRFHSWGRRSVLDKLRYWLGVITTPTEKDYQFPVPASLSGSLYLFRFFRLGLLPLIRIFRTSPPRGSVAAFPHRT